MRARPSRRIDPADVLTVVADENGNLSVDERHRLAVFDGVRHRAPRADELCELPRGSDFFLLPGRTAVGLDASGAPQPVQGRGRRTRLAAAAFLAPAWVRLVHPAYHATPDAPTLPLFAYAPLGFANDRYVTCGVRIDPEGRQDPWRFDLAKIRTRATTTLAERPKNRLIRHLSHCALTYGCRAAQNFFLGRWEAPLPTARACNSRCLGCISEQPDDGVRASHERIAFVPTADEVAEVSLLHASHVEHAVVSFGQGCEGEPLVNDRLLVDAVALIRKSNRQVTVNLNSNSSRPDVVKRLFEVGLSSLRVSLNSVRPASYDAYFRPRGYTFDDVMRSIDVAKAAGGFVSLNYFTCPGFTDRPAEVEALEALIARTGLDMIQWRNLNMDPELYLATMPQEPGEPMGLTTELARLRERFPALRFGYFNPPVPPRVA
jgi:pyruvate-formate lyase-activating enzyme